MPGIVMETDKRTKHLDDSTDFKDSSKSNGDNELNCNQSNRETGEILPNIGRRKVDTWIYPLVQMGPLGICVDQKVTAGILENLDEGSRLHLASGYFNLTQQYKAIILRSRAKCEILLASPQVIKLFHVWKKRGQGGRMVNFLPKNVCFIKLIN